MPPDLLAFADELERRAELHRQAWRDLRSQAAELRLEVTADDRHVSLPSPDLIPPTPIARRERRDWERVVIQVAYEIGTNGKVFSTQDVVDAGVPYQVARKWLRHWTGKGSLEAIQDGGRWWYSVTDVDAPRAQRRKEPTPESTVVQMVRRQEAIAGTGATRFSSPLVASLAREVAAQGVTTRKTKHKIEFVKDGRVIASASSTPGASSLKQTRGKLRQAGVAA